MNHQRNSDSRSGKGRGMDAKGVGRQTQTYQRDCKGLAREGQQTPVQGQTWGECDEAEQTREGKARLLRKPSSNRTGENPPYGMNGGDWGKMGSNAACASVPLYFKSQTPWAVFCRCSAAFPSA